VGESVGGFSQIFSQYTGIDPGLFDLLGPPCTGAQTGIRSSSSATPTCSAASPTDVSGDLTNSATIPLSWRS